MKKLISAGILTLLIVGVSLSHEISEPRSIPSELFANVVVPTLIPVVIDNIPRATDRPRKALTIRTPKPIIVPKKTPKPQVQPPNHTLFGVASWYCKTGISRCTIGHPGGYYAAIRRDLLELRGERVLVCAGKGNCVRVTIIDCNCGPNANLIDLYWDAFAAISNPSLGVVKVTVRW